VPIFFILILPLWSLCVALGVAFCVSKSRRFLSAYLLCCSTAGLVLSITASIGGILLLTKLQNSGHLPQNSLGILILLGSTPFGAMLGVVIGFFAARAINRRLGLHNRPAQSPAVQLA
jgi:hypothetical protein